MVWVNSGRSRDAQPGSRKDFHTESAEFAEPAMFQDWPLIRSHWVSRGRGDADVT
jgi:hypothetical protein